MTANQPNPQPNKPTLDETLLWWQGKHTVAEHHKKFKDARQAIASAIDRIIGIDEQEISPDGVKQYQGRMARNSLRRKQRQRLTAYLNPKTRR